MGANLNLDNVADVLIVGAGPTGLVAALSLKMSGVSVRIVDRSESVDTTSRALGCQSRTMEILESLQAVDEVVAISEPIGTSVSYNEKGEIGRLEWIPPDSPFPYTYVFAQSGLERVLIDRLEKLGVAVEWGFDVNSVDLASDQVVVRSKDNREITAPWLIGADGAHSAVRKCADIAFEGNATGESYYLADLEFKEPPSMETALSWMGPQGTLMMMRMPTNPCHWRLFVDVTEAVTAGTLPVPSMALAQTIIDERGPGPGYMEVTRSIWESIYKVQTRQAVTYRKGHVFLAGDAAHVFPPFGGQGMNTGIQDAYNLAWKLAAVIKGNAAEQLLDTYQDERYPIGRQVIKEVEQRRKSFAVRGKIGRALRDLMFRIVLNIQALQRQVSFTMSQIGQSYHGRSWLAEQTDRVRKARAGDRAPDGPLLDGRLFEKFSPARFTLLVFGTNADVPSLPLEVGVVVIDMNIDTTEKLRTKYQAQKGALVLVRPDGHIGFRGALTDSDALRAYVNRLLIGSKNLVT